MGLLYNDFISNKVRLQSVQTKDNNNIYGIFKSCLQRLLKGLRSRIRVLVCLPPTSTIEYEMFLPATVRLHSDFSPDEDVLM